MDLRAQFGSYVEASYNNIITNDMTGRTHGCIALGATRNLQGLLKCFDLLTGQVVHSRTLNVLPMPDQVVKVLSAWRMRS